MANVVWDPGSVSAVTLSGGNLVATNTGTTSTNQGAHAATGEAKTSGKYYFEVTIINFAGGGGVAVAVGPSGSAYSDVSFIPPSNCVTVLIASGNIWNHSGNTGQNIGTPSNGFVIGVAVDLDHGKIWFRDATTTTWNGGTGDPTNSTTGQVVAGSCLPFVTFGSGLTGGAGVSGNVLTANFGDSAFTGAVPSGYTSGWPSNTIVATRKKRFVIAAT